jgi:hypothetical protein
MTHTHTYHILARRFENSTRFVEHIEAETGYQAVAILVERHPGCDILVMSRDPGRVERARRCQEQTSTGRGSDASERDAQIWAERNGGDA